MKKKIEKLLPEGWKVKGIIKDSPSNTFNLEKGYLNAVFRIKEKKQKPEWIRITKVAPGADFFTKNKLYKVIKWEQNRPMVNHDDNFPCIISESEWVKVNPSKAEIEAHKLGFHVGDEVWINNNPKPNYKCDRVGKITSFYYNDNGKLRAEFKGIGYEYLEHLTKTPPKQPIFQIDGKDIFYGTEFWDIDKAENWKLEKYTIEERNPAWYKDGWNERRFTTKQKALEYVFKEAKRRFEGCKKIKYNSENGNDIQESFASHVPKFRDSKDIDINIYEHHQNISVGVLVVWTSEKGWIAEPIKPLMLGDEVVKIELPYDLKENSHLAIITCKGESVTKEEWMEWYNFIKVAREMSLGMDIITGRLGLYSGTYYKKDRTFIIGCIGKNDTKRATLEQIEAITKELQGC